VDGFHVNGVDDAFGIKTLSTDSSEYYYTLYYPEFEPGIDLFAPIYLNTGKNELQLIYGAGIEPRQLASGQSRLTDIGELGDHPVSGPAFQSRQLLATTRFFWFVQTSSRTYDMVSADDAKEWITWYWIWD
jgi:hypothetical protein